MERGRTPSGSAASSPTHQPRGAYACLQENEDLLLGEQHQEQVCRREQEEELRVETEKLEAVGRAVEERVAAAAAESEQSKKRDVRTAQPPLSHFQPSHRVSTGLVSLLHGLLAVSKRFLQVEGSASSSSKKHKVYMDIPTDAEISRLLLERKKQILYAKYASPGAQKQQEVRLF